MMEKTVKQILEDRVATKRARESQEKFENDIRSAAEQKKLDEARRDIELALEGFDLYAARPGTFRLRVHGIDILIEPRYDTEDCTNEPRESRRILNVHIRYPGVDPMCKLSANDFAQGFAQFLISKRLC